MKKKILLLSIALVSLTAFSFAADAPVVSKNVLHSFQREFSNARDIKWENQTSFIKAQFSQDNLVLFAYFNNNGDLIAVTRNISPDQLPLELRNSIKKSYGDYWVSDLFEIQTATGTDYYVTLQNAEEVVVLKSEGVYGWQNFQKEKKEHAE